MEDSEEKYHNGFRLMRLLDEGTLTLQNKLLSFYQNDVSKLELELAKHKENLRKAIKPKQMEILFPQNARTDSGMYDISLLFVLFRVLKLIKKPKTGWYNEPLESDVTIGASLLRLYNSRNSLCHGRLLKTKTEFTKYLNDIGNSMMSFGCDIKIINDIINMKSGKGEEQLLHDKETELAELRQDYDNIYQRLADLEKSFNDEIWFDVPPLVSSFTGRKEEIKCLHESMHGLGNGIVAAVITGLPGTGKTSLAQYYVYEYHQVYENNVIWIDASTKDRLDYSFVRIGKHLNIKDSNDIEVLITRIYKMLKNRKVLFVFDNAPDEESILKYMPSCTNSLTFLLTSQKSKWGQNFCEFSIPKLSISESITFIKSKVHASLITTINDVNQLAEEIDGYPLALQQSVAYINHFIITIDEFLSRFHSASMTVSQSLFHYPSGDTQYKKQLATSLQMILDELSGPLDKDVMLLLTLMVLLDGSKIDARIFEKFMQEIGDHNEMTLQKLEQLSLIRITANYFEKCRIISIHSLVQKFIRDKIVTSDNVDTSVQKVFNLLHQFILRDRKFLKVGDLAFGNIWIHHCINLFAILKQNTVLINEISCWKRELVRALRYRGNEALAIDMLLCFINHYKRLFGDDSKQILDCLTLLQICYIDLKRWEDGLNVCTHAENLANNLFKPGNQDASTSKHNQAVCLSKLGKQNEALCIYEDLFSSEGLSLVHSESTLITGINLSSELLRAKRHAEALELQDKLLGAIHNFSNYQKSVTYYEICQKKVMTIIDLGKNEEAISMILDLIQECTIHLGEDNLKTIDLKTTLAYCLVSASKYEEGVKMLEQNLKQFENIFSIKHPKYYDVKCMLASCYASLGKSKEALETYMEIKCFVEEEMGSEHTEVTEIEISIARCYFLQGKYENSINLLNSVLKKQTSIYGKEHQLLIRTKKKLAYQQYMIGDYKKALDIHEELREWVANTNGKQHLNIYEHMNWIALCMEKMGQLEESLRIHEEVESHLHDNYSECFELCRANRLNKGICLLAMGRITDAFDIFETDAKSRKTFNDIGLYFALYYLGATYISMDEFSKARAVLLECLALGETLFSKKHIFNLRIHYQMARCDLSTDQTISNVKEKCQYILEHASNVIPAHLTIVGTKILLAQCFLMENKREIAITHCQDALDSSKEILNRNHPILKTAYDILNTK